MRKIITLCLLSVFVFSLEPFCWGASPAAGSNDIVVNRLRKVFSPQQRYQSVVTSSVSLFNGENLDGWETVSGKKEIKAWEAVGGTLHRKSGGGDIVTEKNYGNFILDFDWKIAEGGNSGVKYKFANIDGQWLGCEYQVLDNNKNSDSKLSSHRTGSLYDIIAAPPVEYTKPIGEYNKSRIVFNGNRIQHWLNGHLAVDVVVGSQTWEKGFKASKFNEHPTFGKIARGKILLQDHGDEVWFKNIVLREIKTVEVKKRLPLILRRFQTR